MPSPGDCAALRGVVAYVEVWSSNRTENYSKTFAQQLLDLGAKVSKFFNKEVTHVVFKDGHQGTWKKATKTGVKLVSVLWVEKCIEAGKHVDESLFPAINTNEGLPQIIKKKHKCMQPKDFVEKTPENDRRLQRKFDKMVKELDVQKAAAGFDVPVLLFDGDGELMYSPKAAVTDRGSAMEKRIKEMKDRRENLSPTASQMSQPSMHSSGPTYKPSLGDTPSASTNGSCQEEVISDTLNSSFEDLCGKSRSLKKKANVLSNGENVYASTSEITSKGNSSLMPGSDPPHLTPLRTNGTLLFKKCSLFGARASDTSIVKKSQPTHSLANSPVAKMLMSPVPIALSSKNSDNRAQAKQPEGIKITSAFKAACEIFSEHFTKKEPSDCSVSKVLGDKFSRQMKSPSSLKLPAPTLSPARLKKDTLAGFTTPPKSLQRSDAEEKLLHYEDFFSAAGQKKNKRANRFSLVSLPPKSPSPPPISCGKEVLKSKRRRSAEESDEINSSQSKKRHRTHVRVVPRSTLRKFKLSGRSKSTPSLNGLTNGENDDKMEAPSHLKADSKSSQKQHCRSSTICSSLQTNSSTTDMATCSREPNSILKTVPLVFTAPSTGEKRLAKGISVERIVSCKTPDCTKDETELNAKEANESTLLLTDSTSPETSTREKKEWPLKRYSLSIQNETSDRNTINGLCDVFNDQRSKCNAESKRKERMKKPTRSLVMTSMPSDKQHAIIQVVNTFGGFFFSDNVCETTTHVIVGTPRRTLNIILGIARGCWILSYDWVLWSLEHGCWIPEEPYELSDLFPAAPICRLQRQLPAGEHQQGLFSSQPVMFITATSQPPCDNLVELVQLCGGKVCKTLRQARICIGDYSGKKPPDVLCVSEKWILAFCIGGCCIPGPPVFKRCSVCGCSISVTDSHSACVLCLVNQHPVASCQLCARLHPRYPLSATAPC